MALSGGSTPGKLYSLLATNHGIDWEKIHFFWGDERHVPPDHADSNFRVARETLLSVVRPPESNVHRVPAEEPDASNAARSYEADLKTFFSSDGGGWPRFDLILLGMGPDGHTASLFPGTTALEDRERWVTSAWVEKFQAFRITLTFPAINHASCVMFLVSGADKADTLKRVIRDLEPLPSGRVKPESGKLVWMVDRAAATLL